MIGSALNVGLVSLALWWIGCQAAVWLVGYMGFGVTDVTIHGIQTVIGALTALGALGYWVSNL